MNSNWQKIGLIALFIGSSLLFAFFIYYFFFLPLFAVPPAPAEITANINGQLTTALNINGRLVPVTNINGQLVPAGNANTAPAPAQPTETAQGQLTKTTAFVNKPVRFSALAGDGSILYYDGQDGKFHRVSADGTVSEYSGEVFNNVSNAVWSNSRNRAVLQYPDGSNLLYDFNTGKQYTLPKHWTDFAFSPTDDQIAFKNMALDAENRFLAITDFNGSNARVIEDIGGVEDKFAINWSPNNQVVAMFKENKDAQRSEIYFIGLNNENFKSMVVEGRDFRGVWTPKGDRLVYSVYNSAGNYMPTLWVSDAQGENIGANRQNIGLTTWADKCAFASDSTIYCAVPRTLPFGAGLEPESRQTVSDDIYEINIDTGAKRLLAIPQGYHYIDKIMPAGDGRTLYFSDGGNNKIYKIEL